MGGATNDDRTDTISGVVSGVISPTITGGLAYVENMNEGLSLPTERTGVVVRLLP